MWSPCITMVQILVYMYINITHQGLSISSINHLTYPAKINGDLQEKW